MNKMLHKIQLTMTIIFSLGILMVAIVVTGLTLSSSNTTLRQQVSVLVSANSKQLELNIDSYIREVQQKAALLFSSEEYYGYDPLDATLDDYEKLQREKAINEKIVDLGIIENFSDFGIIYSDESTIGWISQVTKAMFPKGGMYETFAKTIQNPQTSDGWSFGINGNYDRLYYTKRLNPHALVVASIYNRELESVFELPKALNDMTVRLVNADDQILYSSRQREVSTMLPEHIVSLLSGVESGSVMDSEYLVTKDSCQNGWHVICTISVESMTRENSIAAQKTILIVACICCVLILGGIFVYTVFNRSVSGIVTDLNDKASHDLMTGVLNKAFFQSFVTNEIAAVSETQVSSFIMLDLDNFKKVNDQLGHSVGDEVIIRMAKLLQKAFTENVLIGRMGGDEFAIYRNYPELSFEEANEMAHDEIHHLYNCFKREFEKERDICQISVSSGIYLMDKGKYHFEDVYKRADSALYEAKRSGKARPNYVS